MGVGPTLLGGIVGAAVGVGLHTLLETGLLGKPIEASWFAIIIGLLTGVGVRQANRQHMERSYLRGAISGIVALAAIYGSTVVIAEIMKKRDVSIAAKPATTAVDEATGDEAADGAAATAQEPVETPQETANPALGGMGTMQTRASDLNPWQFVWIAIGALVAYELGRGAGAPKTAEPIDATPPEGLGRATDPSE
ncbi:hypothetical protein [Lacipirellula parvula]|uniref:Uncharacterized protein n=1 Tax=Lacipirellula parvula TaxID=2650471 RepID=A0A5K7X816_9BACT|nr:hypothetical protein [Lacipirellula parvula]BBO30891.1 hypothetical protein PLANPX_0503 [Lacipirellula parvula]